MESVTAIIVPILLVMESVTAISVPILLVMELVTAILRVIESYRS